MKNAAVLGSPVGHSLSPVIHRAGYAAAGLDDWHYGAYECGADELRSFVADRDGSWSGLSLTMPLKRVSLIVADEVSILADSIGAANTLVRRGDGGWRAENTDGPGMVDALREAGVSTAEHVSVLGAGGTARAALAAARDLSASRVSVYARDHNDLAEAARRLGLVMQPHPWTAVAGATQADAVISTVPRGVADAVAAVLTWRPGSVLLDVAYDPWPTPLAGAAMAAGASVTSGLDLLLAQAVRQFELFTGVAAPVAAMRVAAMRANVDRVCLER